MDILLDTSFLVAAMQSKIDLVGELRRFGKPKLFVLDLVIEELQKLCKGNNGKDASAAKLSLNFLKVECVEVIEAGKGHTDSKLIEYSMNRDMVVCTIDRQLRDQLLTGGLEVVTIRQSKYLVKESPW